jgi:hypothetical protein
VKAHELEPISDAWLRKTGHTRARRRSRLGLTQMLKLEGRVIALKVSGNGCCLCGARARRLVTRGTLGAAKAFAQAALGKGRPRPGERGVMLMHGAASTGGVYRYCGYSDL